MSSAIAPSCPPAMEKQTIESTQFGVEFVLERMRNVSGDSRITSANLNGISVVDITGGSAFFARVLKVSFDWNNPGIEPKSVVLKVPQVQGIASNSENITDVEGTKEREQAYLEMAHHREVQFYEHFANQDNGLRLPVFYYGFEYSRNHDKGLLVMEDLSRFGRTINILPGLNNPQVENLIDALARLTALSWKDRSWLDVLIVNPPDFQQLSLNMMRTFSLELKKLDKRFEPLVNKMEPFYTVKYHSLSHYKSEKYGFPAALVHGDLWAPNILWRVDENGNVSNELQAIIDWQAVHAGNPLEDFGRLVVLNTSSSYRKANQRRLLNLYIAKLREYGGGESPIHEGNIDEAYKAALPYVAVFLSFGVPMYCNMPSVVRQDLEHKSSETAELLDRAYTFFEEVVDAYEL